MFMVAKKPPKKTAKPERTLVVTAMRDGSVLKEEFWRTEDGEVVKYSLAYINHQICGVDNGRVLGYDNHHGHHHRHFMGTTMPIKFESFDALLSLFESEVQDMWRKRK
jgi:hypothetical protein